VNRRKKKIARLIRLLVEEMSLVSLPAHGEPGAVFRKTADADSEPSTKHVINSGRLQQVLETVVGASRELFDDDSGDPELKHALSVVEDRLVNLQTHTAIKEVSMINDPIHQPGTLRAAAYEGLSVLTKALQERRPELTKEVAMTTVLGTPEGASLMRLYATATLRLKPYAEVASMIAKDEDRQFVNDVQLLNSLVPVR
jgi:hypothetical protein